MLLQAVFQKLVEWGKASVDLNSFSIIPTGNSRNTDALIRILREGSNAPYILILVDGDQGGKDRLRTLRSLLEAHNVKHLMLTKGTTVEDHLPASGKTYIDAVSKYVSSILHTLSAGESSIIEFQEQFRKDAIEKGFSGNEISSGVADWAIDKAQELAGLESRPSKLGIAREYVGYLNNASLDSFRSPQLKRSLTLLQRVQSGLSISNLREPNRSVTED